MTPTPRTKLDPITLEALGIAAGAVTGFWWLGAAAYAQALSHRDLRSSSDDLRHGRAQPQNAYVNALLRGLRELGYVYGEHFVTSLAGPWQHRATIVNRATKLISEALKSVPPKGDPTEDTGSYGC